MTNTPRDEISMDNNARIRDLEVQMREVMSTLSKVSSSCDKSEKQTSDLHRRFLEPAPSGEPPLVDRINKAVRAYEQASWLGKTGLWGLMTLGGLAVASTQIMNWLRGIGKG